MIDGKLEDLPWPEILQDLEWIVPLQAGRLGLRPQDVGDALQDAYCAIREAGMAKLPPLLLLPEERLPWLWGVARNVVLTRLKAEVRWRRVRLPVEAASRVAALKWPQHQAPPPRITCRTGLPHSEAEVLGLLEHGATVAWIARVLALPPEEVDRRARWGRLRQAEGLERVPLPFGLLPGSLAALRGRERWTWVQMFERHAWPQDLVLSELVLDPHVLRTLRWRQRGREGGGSGER
jgi:hypothetical protein